MSNVRLLAEWCFDSPRETLTAGARATEAVKETKDEVVGAVKRR